MDLGFCEKHRRQYEALCKDCEEPVCASCVMFDLHLKHDIVELTEGNVFLRKAIKTEQDKGYLKKEYAEKHLLEIREYSLRLEKLRTDAVKLIENYFNELLTAIKKRKTVLMTELIDYFSSEKDQVSSDEKKWIDYQKTVEKIIALAKDNNDKGILDNAKYIMNSLRDLGNETSFREAKLFNSVDSNLNLDEETVLSFEEIIYYFSKYMEILEPNILEFAA